MTTSPWLFQAKKEELHIGLGIPKASAIEIHNWAEEQDWPDGTELEPIDEYHITMLFAPERKQLDEDGWAHEAHAISINGITSFPSKNGPDHDAIVLTVDSETIHDHHKELVKRAEKAELEISAFSGDDYKPHLTIAYGKLPKGLKPPLLTFETEPSEVSPPREHDLTALLKDSWSGYGCGQIWINEKKKSILINVGDGEGDKIHRIRQLAKQKWPEYDVETEAEIGFPGEGWKLSPDSAAKPTKQEEKKSAWNIVKAHAPYEAELLRFADSWTPKDQWPNALRERNGEPADADCTCKDGHKLDCPVHGMHPTLPTYDDTLEFPDPSSPVGYDYHTDAPRTWMRAETKFAHRAIVDPEGKIHTWNDSRAHADFAAENGWDPNESLATIIIHDGVAEDVQNGPGRYENEVATHIGVKPWGAVDQRDRKWDFQSKATNSYTVDMAKSRARNDDFKHGTVGGYGHHGCRCDACKQAKTVYQREWRIKNPQANKEKNDRWKATHVDQIKAAKKRLHEEHPERARKYFATRKARKLDQFVEEVDPGKVFERDRGICGICKTAVVRGDFHVDHIIPLSRGGEHSYANVQVAHPKCNWVKHAKTNNTHLWLDDTRHPPDESWDWAKDAAEAKKLTKDNDYKHMSLDHDLGIVRYEGKVVINPDALSGGDFAIWLHEHRKHLPKSVNIHSHNSHGIKLMKEILEKHTKVTTDRASDGLEEDWAREFKVHEPSEIEKEVVDLPEHTAANPVVDDWDNERWQRGACLSYAAALHDCDPSLKWGMHFGPNTDPESDAKYEPQHVFVHDDKYAYDSLGRHRLPYKGRPGYEPWSRTRYDVPEGMATDTDFREDGNEDEALEHIRGKHPQYNAQAQLVQYGFNPTQAPQRVIDYLNAPDDQAENDPRFNEMARKHPKYFGKMAGKHTDWHFAVKGHDWETEANDPASFRGELGDPYDYSIGGFGKGMTDQYGRESEWHIGPDWAPEHMSRERGGIYPDKTWFIWPNGDREITWDPDQEGWNFESKIAADEWDTRQYPDSRMMPPTTMQEPAQGNPHPEKEGCTCEEGKKLDCPVHGLEPTEQGYDHSWSIPQGHPVGYPQDQPRNYMKAEGKYWNFQDDEEPVHIREAPRANGEEAWTGLPRAEGGNIEEDEHDDNLKGENVAVPKPPASLRKKRKEREDLELAQEGSLLHSVA